MRATAAVLTAILVVLFPEAAAPALASPSPSPSASPSPLTSDLAPTGAKGGSFNLSGQEHGTLTLNVAETCVADNFYAAPLSEDIRLYLTDHSLRPANALWFMTIGAKSPGTVHYPAKPPNTVALGADSGLKPDILWSTGYGEPGVGSGTVTLKTGFESGSFDLVLAPSTGATRSEKIVGRWSCG